MTSFLRWARLQEKWAFYSGCARRPAALSVIAAGRGAAADIRRRPGQWAHGGPASCAVIALITLANDAATGATIRFKPTFNISETYTDNVRSVREGAETDWITETSAGGRLSANGNRLDLNLNLTGVQEKHLDTNGLDSIRPKILGRANATLLPDHIFLDSSASLSEVITNRLGPVSARDRSLPSNRTQLFLFNVSPRLEHRIGGWVESTLQYNHTESRFSKPSAGVAPADFTGITVSGDPLSPLFPPVTRDQLRASGLTRNQKSDRVSATFGSGTRFNKVSSQLVLSGSTSKSSSSRTLTSSKREEYRADLNNEYQITRRVALLASGGYEKSKNPDSTFASSNATGSVGAHIKPGPRTDFRGTYGFRHNASNVSANFTYKISSFYVLTALFEQAVRTEQDNQLARLNRLIEGPDGTLIDPLTGTIRDPARSNFDLTTSSFREDLFQLGLHGTRGRNSYNFGVDMATRESAQETSKEQLLDVSMGFSRRLWPRLTGSVNLGYSDTLKTTVPENGDTRYQGSASFNYTLGKMFTSSLDYSRLDRRFDAGGQLSEDTVTVGLNVRF